MRRRTSHFDGVVTEDTPDEADAPPRVSVAREPVTPARPPLPFDNRLMQNELPSIQATLSPPAAISWLLLCALFCITAGAIVVNESDSVFEIKVSYGQVNRYKYPRTEAQDNASRANGGVGFVNETGGLQYQGVLTAVLFDVPERVAPPIYLSYTVKGMIMAYRQFERSRSALQMQGDQLGVQDLVKCQPLRSPGELNTAESTALQTVTIGDASRLYGDMIYFPCGAVPWAMFNDTISIFKVEAGSNDRLICNASDFDRDSQRILLTESQNPCSKKDIAWGSDRNRRYLPTAAQFDRVDHWTGRGRENTSDVFLQNGWYYREPGHKVPDPLDEDFMVWMRVPGLANFRRIHRIIHTPLEAGTYRLVVREFFDASSFDGGDKGIEMRSQSWLGAKNYTLGGILIGGGTMSLLLAVVLFARYNLRNMDDEDEALPVDPDDALAAEG